MNAIFFECEAVHLGGQVPPIRRNHQFLFLEQLTLTEAEHSSAALVPTYQTTRRHMLDPGNLFIRCTEDTGYIHYLMWCKSNCKTLQEKYTVQKNALQLRA